MESTVISSQDTIGQLADRIERAYRRRYSQWQAIGLTPGVWMSAASRLLEASEEECGVPIDPELFVAVQIRGGTTPNPWVELTQERSLELYLRALRRIVVQLRKELRSEVRRAERRIHLGLTLEEVLTTEGDGISPLTRYILAHRAGRHDLSIRHRAAAENQHRSCPLYRLASRTFLPSQAYPSADHTYETMNRASELTVFSLN